MPALRHVAMTGAALAAFALPAYAQTAGERPAPVTAGWRDGFVVQSEDGAFRLQIGVLLHADGRFAAADSDEAVTDTFLARRVRPSLRGRIANRFEFYLNPDFAGGTLMLQDAYVDTVFSRALRLRVGKAKSPFGLERLHSASNLLFYERALPTSLAPNRDVGVQVLGDVAGGRVSYGAAIGNGLADGGSGDTDVNDGKDVSARVALRPAAASKTSPLRGLTVAFAASAGTHTGAAALASLRTSSLQQTYFTYRDAAADGRRVRYSPQVSYFHKAFVGFAEYVRSEVPVRRGASRVDVHHDAWQVAASFVLTGEDATDAGTGVRPRAPFNPAAGGWGALQVAARVHALAVDRDVFTLGAAGSRAARTAEAWTVGLNWFLTQNFRYVVNVERTRFDAESGRPAENAIAFRTQLAF